MIDLRQPGQPHPLFARRLRVPLSCDFTILRAAFAAPGRSQSIQGA
jgi:hypothetical protein